MSANDYRLGVELKSSGELVVGGRTAEAITEFTKGGKISFIKLDIEKWRETNKLIERLAAKAGL